MRRLNPDDERFRALERAAATGDQSALAALGGELNRRGLCARCREPRDPMHALTPAHTYICDPCSALVELEAFERGASYTGYLSAQGNIATSRCDNCNAIWMDSELLGPRDLFERLDEDGPDPTGECPTCGALAYPEPSYSVGTFLGFPLLAVSLMRRMSVRGIAWRGYDRAGTEWYGRALDHGFVTGMRRAARSSGLGRQPYAERRYLLPLRAAQYAWIRSRGGPEIVGPPLPVST